jgi:hypothetical protein
MKGDSMDTILFGLFAVAYVALFFFSAAVYKRYRVQSAVLMIPVVLGLVYDKAIISTGRFIGEGALLENLNLMRYWLHAFFTPLLVLFSWKTLEQAHIGWSGEKRALISVLLLTIGLVLLELFTEVFGLVLQPEWEYGVLTYSDAAVSAGPPIMVLFVSLVLLIASTLIWWKLKWRWFFIGSTLMIAGSAIPFPIKSGAVTNLFELALLISLAATSAYQGKGAKTLK